MRLIKLIDGRYPVITPAEAGKSSEVESFLARVPADMQATARGLYTLFERYAEHGRQQLSSSNFHEANKAEGIWQFIKGRLRVYCFIDSDGGLVVLSHGSIKKTQKADPHEVARAVRLKKQYQAAQQDGAIELVGIMDGIEGTGENDGQ